MSAEHLLTRENKTSVQAHEAERKGALSLRQHTQKHRKDIKTARVKVRSPRPSHLYYPHHRVT